MVRADLAKEGRMQKDEMLSRVVRGARLLEQQFPGALDALSGFAGSINIEFEGTCALARLFGTYTEGHAAVFGRSDRDHRHSAAHGFFALARARDELPLNHPEVRMEYAQLTAAWRSILAGYARQRQLQAQRAHRELEAA